MKKKLVSNVLLLICVSAVALGCSKDENAKEETEVKTERFEEGIVEMGIFSNDLDLGLLIQKVDFSKPDVKAQFDNLLKNDKDVKAIFELIENAGVQNPLAPLALTLNMAESTYYIKKDEVLGKVTGFGWTMDNYHNQGEDKGTLYYETLTKTTQIAEQDRKIYTNFKPSQNKFSGASNDVDFSQYNRSKLSTKEIVAGYACDVYVYTPKQNDPNAPAQLHKLIVYASPLFNKTINFTHPYYLEEEAGILRLDIFYADAKTPTLVMKPKLIDQRILDGSALKSRTATPAYTELSTEWAIKALGITMSGWAAVQN